MKIPAKNDILKYLVDADKKNPGSWYQHSLFAAQAAQLIAERCSNLDEEIAFALGGLHDIGRRDGVSNMHHVITGYNFMIKEGFESVARVCLTHSFPIKNVDTYFGKKDCSDEELRFLSDYLNRVRYNDYDRLIQLCDVVSSVKGFCLIEKRLINAMARLGTNSHSKIKIEAYLNLRDYFSDKIGISIYRILPDVIRNTFGFDDDKTAIQDVSKNDWLNEAGIQYNQQHYFKDLDELKGL